MFAGAGTLSRGGRPAGARCESYLHG